jgi:phytoene/squalene synthetase
MVFGLQGRAKKYREALIDLGMHDQVCRMTRELVDGLMGYWENVAVTLGKIATRRIDKSSQISLLYANTTPWTRLWATQIGSDGALLIAFGREGMG